MATRIRLQRRGAKKRPFFRIVVADSRGKRNGSFIENIGFFDPIPDPAKIEINEEKAVQWLLKGAEPSERVRNLFNKTQVYDKFKAAKQQPSQQS